MSMMIKDKPNTNLMDNNELAAELYEAYENLSKNKDFEVLIEKGFMTNFAENQLGMLSTSTGDGRKMVEDTLLGVSVLSRWLMTVEMLGSKAKIALEEGEKAEMTGEDVPTLEEEVGV